MASVFLQDFKKYREMDEADTSLDEIVDLALNASEKFIENYCNIKVGKEDTTITLDGNGSYYLKLPIYPINTLTDITVDDVYYSDMSKFYIKYGTTIVKIDREVIFTLGIQNIKITLNVGYDTTTIPSDLKLALYKIADKFVTDALENREDLAGYATGIGVNEKFKPTDLPRSVKKLLNPYVRVYLG